MKRVTEREKISLAQCKKILGKNGCQYSEEELIKVRDWIYHISELTVQFLESRTPDELLRIHRILNSNDIENGKLP